MRGRAVGVWWGLRLAVAALVVAAACSKAEPCPAMVKALPAKNQPFGGACSGNEDCAQGLQCMSTGGASPSWKMCTRPCDPCPGGFNECVTLQAAKGEAQEQKICIPSCHDDADCVRGEHVMKCVATAGAAASCRFVECTKDTDCPASRCVAVACIEDESGYSLSSGYCQRVH